MTQIKVYAGVDEVSVAHRGATILESLEIAGLKPLSQCKDGFCGACRISLISGDVQYISKPVGYVSQNEILPCCCKPVGAIEVSL